jgi:hypothetical protein
MAQPGRQCHYLPTGGRLLSDLVVSPSQCRLFCNSSRPFTTWFLYCGSGCHKQYPKEIVELVEAVMNDMKDKRWSRAQRRVAFGAQQQQQKYQG